MFLKKTLILIVLLSIQVIYVNAQRAIISGKISSSSGAIEFASVYLKNSTYGTSSDIDGTYSFSAPAGNYTLVVSVLGFKTIEKSVAVKNGENKVVDIRMNEDNVTLNEVLIVGKNAVQRINESAYNVVALDAKQLHNSTLDLSHALDRISGVRVRESGGVGSSYSFSLNGFSGKQVKFFIDGIPMENFGSSFQINNIPINLAERVEVYKGVVPISFGSDALGGAVNIVSNTREGTFVDASYSYGSFNTHRSYVNVGYTSKSGFTVQLNAFQNYSDNNYKVTTDIVDLNTGLKTENVRLKRFHDKYHNETVIFNLGVVNKSYADRLLLGITLGQNRADVQTGARMKEFVFGDRFRRGNTIMPTLRYSKHNLLVEGLNVSLNGNINFGYEQTVDTVARQYNWLGEYIEKPRPGSERNRTMYKYRNNSGVLSANVNYKIDEYQTVSLNNVLNRFDRKGKDELYPESEKYDQPRKTTKNVSGLEYKFNLKDVVSASAFIKNYLQKSSYFETKAGAGGWGTTDYVPVDKTHSAWGYGIAGTSFLTKNLQLKASYEKSLRMPDNEELFGNEGNNLEGNMVLKPESSHNINLGATYNFHINNVHGIILDASWLYRDSRDFIRPQLVTNGTDIVMVNQDKVKNNGFNAELRYSYKTRFTAGGNMTYQNIRNNTKYLTFEDGSQKLSQTYNDRMPNIPYLYGNADCSLFFDRVGGEGNRLTLGYNLLYVHEYYLRWPSEGLASSKSVIPTQLSHDLDVTYTMKNGTYNVVFACRNVFDADLYDNFSLQKPGRSFSIKFRYFFSK